MNAIGELKKFRIPVQVKDIKEFDDGRVINPKDAIVVGRCHLGIVVEGTLQFRCPMHDIQLGIVSAPTQV